MFTSDKQNDVEMLTVTFTVYALKQNNKHALILYNRC